MFKNVIKYCMMVYMFVACSATMANPHIQTEEPTKNFNKNVSNDLVFYVLGDTFKVDKEFTVPAVLRYFFTPEGTRVQLVHVNQQRQGQDVMACRDCQHRFLTGQIPQLLGQNWVGSQNSDENGWWA